MKISLIAAIIFLIGSAQSATMKVNPNDTIQEAIDSAQEGDLIEVQSGTYYENIDVSKRIDLKGIGNPIVDSGKKGNGITLSANGIVLEGFTIVNARENGIKVLSNNNTIKANIVSGNLLCGIELYNSNNNTLSNNLAKNNQFGIGLRNSLNNQLVGNIVNNNNDSGIILFESSNNLLSDNIVRENKDPKRSEDQPGHTVTYGIFIDNSMNNYIKENKVEDNNVGISIRTYEPKSTSAGSINNNISLNTIKNNEYGIMLSDCDHNKIYKNIIINSMWSGLHLSEANYNEIFKNNVTRNLKVGIVIEGSNNAIHNNIMDYNGDDGLVVYDINNTIIGNELNHNGKSGISLGDDSRMNIIERNSVTFNMQFGIVTDLKSKDNTLNNNYLQNNGLEWRGSPNLDNEFANSCDVTGANWWDGIPKRVCTLKTPNLYTNSGK